jgi:lipopolysaccharide export system protein LptC
MFILLVAAVLAWWLSRGPEALLYRPAPLLRHEPDYFLENFTMTSAGEDGLPRYRMSGVSMMHYPDDDTALLEQLRLEYIAVDGEHWIITARQAQAEQKGNFVHLLGDVSIFSGDEVAPKWVLKTEVLNVHMAEGFAETDQEVMISQSYGVTRAQGLHLNFSQRQLHLKSRVRGEYAIPTG